MSGLSLKDSPFWTTHFYRSHHIKLLQLRITSPAEPVKAPSTDAIDIDACQDVHVSGCYMAVNDDAVALKGGKGPWADTDPNNGANERIVIEDCEYGFCHGCLTLGSENIHSRNIVLRRTVWPTARGCCGSRCAPTRRSTTNTSAWRTSRGRSTTSSHRPWTQFFDLQGAPTCRCRWRNTSACGAAR